MLLGFILPGIDSTLAIAVATLTIGIALWLAGSRFSRSAVTLLGVGVGTEIGLHVPGWLGWSIDKMGPGIGGAVVLGMCGYLLHRGWIAAVLCLLLVAWATLFTAILTSGGLHSVSIPRLTLQSLTTFSPMALSLSLKGCCVGGIVLGILIGIFWPRLAQILTHSLLGASLMLPATLWLIHQYKSAWLNLAPTRASAQIAGLIAIASIGALVQWWLMPKSKPAGKSKVRSSNGSHRMNSAAVQHLQGAH